MGNVHGRNWQTLEKKLSKGFNFSYWHKKIETNIARDKVNTERLKQSGWMVLRFWETDIKQSPQKIALIIQKSLLKRSGAIDHKTV